MIPYWLTYRPSPTLAECWPGSLVVLPDNEQFLDRVTGAMLAARDLRAVIQTGCNEDYLTNPDHWDRYLNALHLRCAAQGITPVAWMIEEEWWDRCNNPADVAGWPVFAGMTEWQRKEWLRPRLAELYRRTKARGLLTVAVETKWNDDATFGSGLWYPDYGADVLGADPYLWARGWPLVGTPPLTDSDGPEMCEKFKREVAWVVEGVGAWKGVLHYGRPVMLVAQAFRDRDPNGLWATVPTAAQLHWWLDLAERHPQIVALAAFAHRSAASVACMDELPETRAAVDALHAEGS
jgi:hypothetical protein